MVDCPTRAHSETDGSTIFVLGLNGSKKKCLVKKLESSLTMISIGRFFKTDMPILEVLNMVILA